MPVSFCSACGRVFAGTVAFDAHRTGSFTPLRRRCMADHEMRQAGMFLNEKGRWACLSAFSTIAARPKLSQKRRR